MRISLINFKFKPSHFKTSFSMSGQAHGLLAWIGIASDLWISSFVRSLNLMQPLLILDFPKPCKTITGLVLSFQQNECQIRNQRIFMYFMWPASYQMKTMSVSSDDLGWPLSVWGRLPAISGCFKSFRQRLTRYVRLQRLQCACISCNSSQNVNECLTWPTILLFILLPFRRK